MKFREYTNKCLKKCSKYNQVALMLNIIHSKKIKYARGLIPFALWLRAARSPFQGSITSKCVFPAALSHTSRHITFFYFFSIAGYSQRHGDIPPSALINVSSPFIQLKVMYANSSLKMKTSSCQCGALLCGKLKTPRVIYEDSARDESNIVDGWIHDEHNMRASFSLNSHTSARVCVGMN